MIYLELLLGFLKVGTFAFGGAYGAIPLIRDVVLDYGWLTDEQLTYMIAVSESTPGPIMLNLATYVGSSQAGLIGSLLATTSVVLPSFLIILLVMGLLKNCLKHPWIQALLRGVKPCIIGIILATGLYMTASHCVPALDLLAAGDSPTTNSAALLNLRAVIMTALLVCAMAVYRKACGKKMSPILLIAASALLGIIVYTI